MASLVVREMMPDCVMPDLLSTVYGSKLRANEALGKRHRLEQIAAGANLADARQVRSDVAPLVADAMARRARSLRAEEQRSPAFRIAADQGVFQFFQPLTLPFQIDIASLEQRIGLRNEYRSAVFPRVLRGDRPAAPKVPAIFRAIESTSGQLGQRSEFSTARIKAGISKGPASAINSTT